MIPTCSDVRRAHHHIALWLPGIAAAAIGLVGARNAQAQPVARPALPVGPYDWAIPTPAAPPPLVLPPILQDQPPFDSPLPPAMNMPPSIHILPGTPPPGPVRMRSPAGAYPDIPQNPGYPAPLTLPERVDEGAAPAGGLRQSMDEYDRRVGLGATGPIVSSARAVAQSEWVTGDAIIEVIADRTGAIKSTRVVRSSRDATGWLRYAEELKSTPRADLLLPEQTLRLPEQARGLWTLIQISAQNERPTGRRQWWSPGVALVFDVTNIHSHPVRTIHSQVLSEVWY